MTVRIGHASKDENNKATGGAAGDQTGKEVKISNWYSNNWEFIARAKDPTIAEIIASTAEAGCKNDNIGYDQSGRNTLTTQAKAVNFNLSKITTPCETDCSAFVSVCVRAALKKDFYKGNAPTTRTLKQVLSSTGAFDILTDKKYLNSSEYLRRGDILNKPGSHVVVVLDTNTTAAIEEKQPSAIKIDSAKSYNKNIAGKYVVTASKLNVRVGAGTKKTVLKVIDYGTKVRNYGYYTSVLGTKWLLVQFTVDGETYTGFLSSKYAKKI